MTDERIIDMEITRKDTSAFNHLTKVCYQYELPTENYNEALIMALNGLHTHEKIYGKPSNAIIGKVKQDELVSYEVFIKK